ncbi:head morphogenesis protein [Ensifer sp. NBAIM29]|nr:head morphogenesis protein [Ensifer sp. NBAIM29]
MRAALDAPDFNAARQALLALAAKWSPDGLAKRIGEALELAALQGREAAFLDGEEDPSEFADADVVDQPFREQIEFFRQKRAKPTKAWTDAMRGTHDRAFVIAGATDTAMLSDFQTAIAGAMENGTTLDDFRKDFDRIVAKYGWQYKGKRSWRTRVIFETNIRSAYMAGRLKQMRDPDVLKLRPIWQYRHGETRTPKNPRPRHKAWHGLCLRHDDAFWDTHFPPNDWFCSCGVRSLSLRDLKRLGKDGLDTAPAKLFEPVIDPVSGQLTEIPQGIGYGWDYQPGNLWEQGLVPSMLTENGTPLLASPRHAVLIDAPEPIDDLVAAAKPFKAKPLNEGLEPEDYIRAFLKPFGGDIGSAVLFEDKAGTKVPVSDLLFRDRRGALKVMKGDRATITPFLAEALMDPDEIWIGVARKKEPADANAEDLIVDRRYIRADPKTGLMIVFEIGEKLWEAVTAYNTTTKAGTPDLAALDRRRGGKLIYKRPKK